MSKRTFLLRLLALMSALLLLAGCAGKGGGTETSGTGAPTTGSTTIPTERSTDVTVPTENTSEATTDTTTVTTIGEDEPSSIPPVKTQARPWVTATRGSGSSTTTKPAERNIYTKAELLAMVNYLTFETDQYAIGAHFYGNPDVKNRIREFEKHTGKAPAYVDFDMNGLPFISERSVQSAVSQLTDFAKSGGFIALTNHWLTPTIAISDANAGGANNSRYELTREQYYEVMTAGTTLNTNFLSELKITAEFIKMLRENGVPVIYRPLHEANAASFWWGIHENLNITGKDVAALYRYVVRYFTETCGLDNILWEFNPSINGGQSMACDWYPGDQYVDILSVDWYLPNNNYLDYYSEIIKKCGKKPFAISEYGGDGNYDTSKYPLTATLSIAEKYLNQGAKTAYIGLYFDMSAKQDWTLSPRAITLDQMSDYWAKSRR